MSNPEQNPHNNLPITVHHEHQLVADENGELVIDSKLVARPVLKIQLGDDFIVAADKVATELGMSRDVLLHQILMDAVKKKREELESE